MYLNHLMTDRELIDAAQYAENPHLKLLAERLDDKLNVIQKAKDAMLDIELPNAALHLKQNVINILES
jgi:hypothetical protein